MHIQIISERESPRCYNVIVMVDGKSSLTVTDIEIESDARFVAETLSKIIMYAHSNGLNGKQMSFEVIETDDASKYADVV